LVSAGQAVVEAGTLLSENRKTKRLLDAVPAGRSVDLAEPVDRLDHLLGVVAEEPIHAITDDLG